MAKQSQQAKFLTFFKVTPKSMVGFFIMMSVLIYAQPNETSLTIGIFVVAVGMLTRLFATAFRYDDQTFAIRGPYRFVRHPHHLGTLLLALGLSLASRNVYILFLSLIIIGYLYNDLIRKEEYRLERLWGKRYLIFKDHVSAIFPQLFPFVPAGGEGKSYSVKKAFIRGRFRELSALAGILVSFMMMYWRMYEAPLNWYYGVVLGLFLVFAVVRPLYYRWK